MSLFHRTAQDLVANATLLYGRLISFTGFRESSLRIQNAVVSFVCLALSCTLTYPLSWRSCTATAHLSYPSTVGRWKLIGTYQKKYTYVCTRHGPKPVIDRLKNEPRRPRERIRSTKSKRTGCKFSICGVQVDDHHWEVRHRSKTEFGIHNHPQSHSALERAAHRRPNKAQIEKARELHGIGMFKQLQESFEQLDGFRI
jgi:hypothetical protein